MPSPSRKKSRLNSASWGSMPGYWPRNTKVVERQSEDIALEYLSATRPARLPSRNRPTEEEEEEDIYRSGPVEERTGAVPTYISLNVCYSRLTLERYDRNT
ncbi:hypothetical protein DFH09DRAFT_1098476 [Mycena vulgaris]|nr:hypothetical protein DFH09DRAFT_1098476 [Mycena vulgaris]